MPVGTKREKVVYGLGAARGTVHRYNWWRLAVGVVCTVGVACLAFFDVMRFDFWRGEHRYLGEPLDLVSAAKAFAFPFLAINIVIILASRFIGRYLCGFVCPVGNLARIFEWVRYKGRRGAHRVLGPLAALVMCLAMAVITFHFWIDLRVFLEGSTQARLLSAGLLLGLTGVLWLPSRFLGLRFCRDYCPSGVYFSVLGPNTMTGVEFANPDNCTDCHACETACPMDLQPRELAGPPHREAMGFYPEHSTNHSLCIRCGDCVAACEGTAGKEEALALPLRMGVLSAAAAEEPGEE